VLHTLMVANGMPQIYKNCNAKVEPFDE